MLHQLLYSSVAADHIGEHAMRGLLEHARRRNATTGISGVLIYYPSTGELVQVLEGRRDAVLALMEKLHGDPRHRRVTVHYEAMISERNLGDWPMGYLLAEADGDLRQAAGEPDRGGIASQGRDPGNAIGNRFLRFIRHRVPEGAILH